MQSPAVLRREAEEAQHLAKIVSYAEDKKRLTLMAERLLRQADELERAERDEDPPLRRTGAASWMSDLDTRR